MLVFWTELALSLLLTVSSLRSLPRQTQYDPDDNEEIISSADSSLDQGRVSNLVATPPKLLAAWFPFGHSPRRPSPPLPPEMASRQWSTFLGLQRRSGGASAKGADLPSRGLGYPGPARPSAVAGGFPGRRRPVDWARVPAPAFLGARLWESRRKAGGLQIRKTTALGVWDPAPNLIKRGHFQTKQGTLDLHAKKMSHQRPFRQNAGDLPTGQATGDEDWGSGAGNTDNFQPKPQGKTRTWHPSALPSRLDVETRQRTAEEAWRRLIEKGRGVTEEIVLPLTEHEATRSNCRTVPFTQNISHPSCKTSAVQNRLCFGQCSSFFIPGAEQQLYRSCSRCFPSRLRKATVLLECEGGLVVNKEVTLVEECQCDLEKEPPLGK